MKLGTEVGNLANYFLSASSNTQPEIGMGCTILMWSDRKAGTVTQFEKGVITVQEDTAIRTDKNDMSENQEYRYERNEKGRLFYYKKNKQGKWREVQLNENKRFIFIDSTYLRLGERDAFYDFCF